jgi:SAM-dependent methyltransferase
MSTLRSRVVHAQYAPGMLGLLLNPYYFARVGLYEAVRELAPAVRGRLLDVGCGSKPYLSLFAASEYVGLEIDTPENRISKRADFFYDGTRFPFGDGEFEGMLVSQVLEHVFNPAEFLTEMHRVLRPGGMLLLTVPFVWDEHEQPVDYARYSSFGLRHLLESHGFEVVHMRKSCADARALFQLFNAYLVKTLFTPNVRLNMLLTMLLLFPVNLVGATLGRLLPANADFYLDNVVLARRLAAG